MRSMLFAGGALAVALVLSGCGGAAVVSPVPSASAIAVVSPATTPAAATASDAPLGSPADSPAASASDPPSDAPSPAALDACAVITPAEASRVTGGKLQAPVPEGTPVTRCVWTALPTGEIAQLEIDLGDGAKKSYDIDLTVLKHVFKPVPGVGDEAYAEDDAIFFRKGNTWVAIHLVRLNDAARNAANLAAVAKAVAGRI